MLICTLYYIHHRIDHRRCRKPEDWMVGWKQEGFDVYWCLGNLMKLIDNSTAIINDDVISHFTDSQRVWFSISTLVEICLSLGKQVGDPLFFLLWNVCKTHMYTVRELYAILSARFCFITGNSWHKGEISYFICLMCVDGKGLFQQVRPAVVISTCSRLTC